PPTPRGRSAAASRVATFRLAPACRCSWCRSWRSRRSSSCGISPNAGTRPDEHAHCRQVRTSAQGQVWQHEPRSRLGAAVVVFLSGGVCDLLADAAVLYADHLAQEQRRDFGGNQPVVVFHPTLSNYIELLTSNQYLRFFLNSA